MNLYLYQNKFMFFFNSVYYYLYNKSKRGNAAPEIPVITFISFCQADNIALIVNVFLMIGGFRGDLKVHYIYFVFFLLLTLLNSYYYQTKKKGQEILQDKKYILKRHGLWVDAYLWGSVISAGYSFYIYREYFWMPE